MLRRDRRSRAPRLQVVSVHALDLQRRRSVDIPQQQQSIPAMLYIISFCSASGDETAERLTMPCSLLHRRSYGVAAERIPAEAVAAGSWG